MKIEAEEYLDFSQVLLKPKRSTLASRSEAILTRTITLPYYQHKIEGIPIMSSNMDTVSTIEASMELTDCGLFSILHKHYSVSKFVEYFRTINCKDKDLVFYSMGISDSDKEKYEAVVKQLGYSPNVCVDIANGYSELFVDYIANLRDSVDDSIAIMAGNVCTPEITEELIFKGADIVKVGIGSGSVCTTRAVAGVGIPQFSCVVECADAAHGVKGFVCSDGGITCPGDVVKAFGAGADFVMIGSEFAAHQENSNARNTTDTVEVYGMSSSTAMVKHGGVKEYRSSEGRTVSIPYRGSLKDTIQYYLGGLRSGMTYIGAETIKEIPKRATFIRVQNTINNNLSAYTNTIR